MQPSYLWLSFPSRLHSLCTYMEMGPDSTGISCDLLIFTMCRAIPTRKGEAVGWRKHLIPNFGFSIRCNALFIRVGQAFSLGNVTFKMETKEVIAQEYWLMNAIVFRWWGNETGWRSLGLTASFFFYASALVNAFSLYLRPVFVTLNRYVCL